MQNLQDDVDSVETVLVFSLNISGFEVDVRSETAFQAPDQMHMTMALTGLGSFEVLQIGTDIYMNVPPLGWIVLSLEDLGTGGSGLADLGLDIATFQDLLSNHGVVDYAALLGGVGDDLEDLGEETVDGGTYRHYRGTIDFADVVASFSDASGTTADLSLEDASGALVFDAWVDTESLLPHKFTASGEFSFGAGSMVFDATMLFTSYNEPVEIPGAPADAIPLAGLLAGLD